MSAPLTPYQRRLVIFLSVASFFEGYDFMALSQLLPTIRADLGISIPGGGRLFAFVNLGTVVSYLLVRHADRLGRRKLLFATIAGYTLCTAATGLSRTVYDFALFQFLARVFLIAEWAVAMVTAAEEFPAERRGALIGVIQAIGSLGSIACAALVPAMLRLPTGWRSVYLFSIVPLLLLAVYRRGLRESARFAALAEAQGQAQGQGEAQGREVQDLFVIFRTPYRRRVLQLALIWGLCYICSNNAIAFWKEFALNERGLTQEQAGGALAVGAVVSLPLLFFVGRLLDRVGRRRAAAVILSVCALGVAGAYTLHHPTTLSLALLVATFGVGSTLPLLNAFTSELFPTALRGTAFAWANNLLGRISYVLSPIVIAQVADYTGFGPVLLVTCLFPLAALALILLWLPETAGRELEETSVLS
jgi:putative MFS transporter